MQSSHIKPDFPSSHNRNIDAVHEEPPISLSAGLSTPHDATLAELRDTSSCGQPIRKHPRLEDPRYAMLNDPFDGSEIGTLTLMDTHPSPTQTMSYPGGNTEELWTHLSRVLELQSEIARMHVNMEGIGNKTADYGKGKPKSKSTRQSTKSWKTPGTSTSNEEDEGVDVNAEVDEEEAKDREREEEFAQLADQFEGRREGINEIMSRVSKAYGFP